MGMILSPEAEADLDGIWFYAARAGDSIDGANRFVDSITERFWLLARYPRTGRRRDDDLRAGLRTFPAGEFLIVYRIEDGDALILRVLHGRQDLVEIFGG